MKELALKEFAENIKKGNPAYLARAISLAESSLKADRDFVQKLLNELKQFTSSRKPQKGTDPTTKKERIRAFPSKINLSDTNRDKNLITRTLASEVTTKNPIDAVDPDIETLRIGITGPPGAGKSTFIERFGLSLIAQGHKVAVLAVDPSSPVSGGSILGDKTRMQELSRAKEAFIRPSPSRGAMGGVTRSTQVSIALCEAAGFDRIIVESVGVGQSEYAVADMVDVFVVLTIANAGDDLQGIKRGILEFADLVVVNKADGSKVKESQSAAKMLSQAFSILFASDESAPSVIPLSSISDFGWHEFFDAIKTFVDRQLLGSAFQKRRQNQLVSWFEAELRANYEVWLTAHSAEISLLSEKIRSGELDPLSAGQKLRISQK